MTNRIWLILVFLGVSAAHAGPQPLVDALMRSENFKVRLKAARALGRLDSEEAQDALTIALGDPNALVRASAVDGLGRTRPPRALAGLCRLRGDTDALVRRTVARSLEGYGGSDACDRRKVLVAMSVSGDGGPLTALITDRLVERARAHARMVVEGPATAELRQQVDGGRAPGVKLLVRMSHRVDRGAAGVVIACEMSQSIFDLKQQALRGSATQRASVELGGSSVSEREVAVQTQACLEALVPAVYDGLVGYVARL